MEQKTVHLHKYVLDSRQHVAGNDLTLVFVHGLAVSSRYWLPLADQFIGKYDMYIPDFPGFGTSPKPERTLTIAEQADILSEYINSVNPSKAVLVGNSLGCQIIMELLYRQDDPRIQAVVLSGPSVNMYERSMLKQSLRWMQATMYEPVSEYGMLLADYVRAGPRQIYQTFQYAVRDQPEAKAASIGQPVLLLRGSQDPLVPKAWLDELAQRLPGGRTAEIRGRGHLVHLSDPPGTAKLIRDFIALELK